MGPFCRMSDCDAAVPEMWGRSEPEDTEGVARACFDFSIFRRALRLGVVETFQSFFVHQSFSLSLLSFKLG